MLSPVTIHAAQRYAVSMKDLDDDTRTFFFKTWGCARKVYNLYVDLYYQALEKAGYKGGHDIPKVNIPTEKTFKKQYPYMNEADSLALMNARLHFQDAVKRYREEHDHVSYTKRAIRRDSSKTEPLSFRGLKGMPKFHSKANGDFSYTTNCQYKTGKAGNVTATIRLSGEMLHLPKLPKDIRLCVDRPLPKDAVIRNATVSMDTDGRIFVSINYERTITMDMRIREAAINDDASILDELSFLGLDYSQHDFYADSEGRKANYPHYYRESEGKLQKLQRELSRMKKDSANYKKKQKQIQKLHVKICNQRKDYLQKESSYLVSRYDVIVVEDINLRAMGECLNLGKNLHDNGFGMFRDMLKYKLERKGSFLIKVDRFFPSSQICHVCGYQNPDTKNLNLREWVCPECKTHHDRDNNAGKNIEQEGRRVFLVQVRELIQEESGAQTRAENKKNARKRKRKTA